MALDSTGQEHACSRAMNGGCGVLVPLVFLVLGLGSAGYIMAGDLAVPMLTREWLYFVLVMASLYGLIAFAILLLHSAIEAPRHIDPATCEVRFRPLWRRVAWNPLPGLVIVLLTVCGCTSASNLTEIYRAHASVWHDPMLWQLEFPIFAHLRGSWLDWPQFWDQIYFQMWTFVLLAVVFTHRRSGLRDCAILGGAVMLAYYLTRAINLAFPVAGPAFFQPGWFSLDGTFSQTTQRIIQAYTAGHIPANGVYPATMAMPSLHVGLTAMAAGFLARGRRWTLWFSLPWLLLVWMSTVMLGWHYGLDGLAGIAVGGLAVFLAIRLQDGWDKLAQRAVLTSLPRRIWGAASTFACYCLLASASRRKYGKTEG